MKRIASIILIVVLQFAGGARAQTDASIEIVFDRNKGSLYAIYGRELRTNPKLSGKVVVEIDIAKDGGTTGCRVKSSTTNAPAFDAKLCQRILQFRFQPRSSPATVLKPIDFFPAA